MSYLFLANATIEITPATGEKIALDVKVRFYKIVPKRAPSGMLTVDGGNAQEFKLTRGAGLGSIAKSYVYFVYGDRTAYAELTDEAYAKIVGSTVKVTTLTAPVAAPETEQAPETAPEPVKAERKARRVKA